VEELMETHRIGCRRSSIGCMRSGIGCVVSSIGCIRSCVGCMMIRQAKRGERICCSTSRVGSRVSKILVSGGTR
jgi:hypothetical protein